jgi:hypothetical protein
MMLLKHAAISAANVGLDDHRCAPAWFFMFLNAPIAHRHAPGQINPSVLLQDTNGR